ncbi:MAG: hypothetical protein K9M49_03575 [Candidatus Marinimicrobia bacterium]|nr:hypothetical protein [Candidatus Neomarinimicrobiota bacterium]MCF7904215.1 hypothetical protein [Candidatus Neomarinimicrobiota bacterium]
MKYPKSKQLIMGSAFILLILITQVFAAPGTNRELLSQKILLENTINQRVSDAVYRILRHENFIVNVNVIMEATAAQKYTTVYETPGAQAMDSGDYSTADGATKLAAKAPGQQNITPTGRPSVRDKKTKTVLKKRPIETGMSSDIPGFPGIQSPGFELYEEEVLADDESTDGVVYAAAEDLDNMAPTEGGVVDTSVAAEAVLSLDEKQVITEESETSETGGDQALINYARPESPSLSRHTVAATTGPSLRVKKMELTVILEDPVSPKIIENIRTVTMVASHFNRDRGDKLQVMTADFQGAKNDKPDTEQILLKSIAEKMTAIEARQKEETENKRIKELEAEQERMRLEQANKEARETELQKIRKQEAEQQRAHEQELAQIRQEEQDRIRQREEELTTLRREEQQRLDEERRQMFEAQQEAAKDRLRQDSLRLALLTEQLDDLKQQLSAVDLEEEQRLKLELEQKRREAEKMAIREREDKLKQQMAELEDQRLQAAVIPDDDDDMFPLALIGAGVLIALAILLAAMMGGRRKAAYAGAAPAPVGDDNVSEAAPQKPVAEEEEDPEPDVDPELMTEVDGIKKSVVSLAVSKPGNASNIVKEWLKDTGAPEEAETEEAEAEANGKNKKKGKK